MEEKFILQGAIKSMMMIIENVARDTMLVTHDLDISQRFTKIYYELEEISDMLYEIN